MTAIRPLLWILATSFSGGFLLNKRFGKVLPLTFIGAALVMYFSGLCGDLRYGFWLLLFSPVVLLLLGFARRESLRKGLQNFVCIDLFCFLLLYVYLSLYHRQTVFSLWDEYMHWGPMVKEMGRLHQFYTVEASTLLTHKDYPPLIPGFELFWCYLSGSFAEACIFRGLAIFSATFFLPFMEKKKGTKLDIFSPLVIFLLFVLLNTIAFKELGSAFTTIYLDYFMAAYVAYAVFLCFCYEESTFADGQLIIVLSSLLLVKQMGITFYALAVLTLVGKCLLCKKSGKKILSLLFCIVAFSLLCNGSWSLYKSQFTLSAQFSLRQIALGDFFGILFGQGTPLQQEVLQHFVHRIFKGNLLQIDPFPSSYFILVGFCAFVLFFYDRKKTSTKKYLLSGAYILGSLVYSLAMLLLYLFSFDSFESVQLASFDRYMNSYIYFGVALMVMRATYSFSKAGDLRKPLILIILLLGLANSHIAQAFIGSANTNYLQKENYQTALKKIKQDTLPNTKTLIVSQFQDDIVWILRYFYPDRRFEVISLGKEKYEKDVYSRNLSLAKWQEKLQEYDYIYIYFSDEAFYQDYWKPLTKTDLWNEYTYRYQDHDFCRVAECPSQN